MPVLALLPVPSALASPVRSALADPLPAPAERRTPVLARPPPVAWALPVEMAVSTGPCPCPVGGCWNTAQTRAPMATAAWTEAPTSCPVFGLFSNQNNGVETMPATATTMTVIFPPRDTPHSSHQANHQQKLPASH